MGQRMRIWWRITVTLVLVATLLGAGPAAAQEVGAPSGEDDPHPCGVPVWSQDGTLEAVDLLPQRFRLAQLGVDLRIREAALPSATSLERIHRDCFGWPPPDEPLPPRSLALHLDASGQRAALSVGGELRSLVGARWFEIWERTEGLTPFSARVPVALDGLAEVLERAPADDPLGCHALVYDPERLLEDDASLWTDVFLAQGRGLDLRVRVEGASDGDIDERIEQLDDVCGWRDEQGERPDGQVVLMVQPSQRSTGLWYGRRWAEHLDEYWEAIQQQEMNPHFREGRWAEGLRSGLRAIAEQRRPWTRSSSSSDSEPFSWRSEVDEEDSGSGGGSGVVVLAFFVLVILVVGGNLLAAQRRSEGGWADEGAGGWSSTRSTHRSWSSGSSRRSSSSSSSTRRASSRSSSSRSSSSRGSSSQSSGRRSGGGSTRW